ncbi:hem peroxidase [Rhypophila decipiens]
MPSKLADLNEAIKKAFTPEAKYPHTPGNLEPETVPDLLGDIKALGFKDYQTLLTFLNAAVTGVVDDNELLLEKLVQLLAKLPASSKEGKQLTDGLLTQLWLALDHPPCTSLGPDFKYRSADGSGNNVNHPGLGAANTAYARTVPPMTFQNPNQPDPSLIFDTLMSRGDKFVPHPQGISSMLFYLATIIIHDIFQTSSSDYNINLTSSYLDLAPLYGRNEQELKAMRTFSDGLIKSDCFSSKRILGFPPGCGVLLVMFNRFHNYVVTQLAKINENGRFSKPNPDKLSGDALKAAWDRYDNDLFQTGRLVTCGLYGNIILKDYVRSILALNRTDSVWDLDPRSKSGKNVFSQPSPQAVGNQVSAEFNLIYRWHSAISQRDEKWTIDEFTRLLEGKDPSEAKLEEVLRALSKFERSMSDAPQERTFAGVARHLDGTLDDDALVKILKESIEDVAGSFGANKVPDCMKTIEILGIMQARYWNVATLNEFRAFMGLTRHTTFEDINPDPVVAKKLQDLYDSPDAVEFYPGLVAEKPKPAMSPGSGLCVNYTTSKAILSDAVGLIRGDRFYTVDYTPKNLTNWAYNEANYDNSVNQGHVFSKLIFRAFPSHFAQNSIYAHFPLVTPAENKKIHDSLGSSHKYSWDPPKRKPELVLIRSHAAAKTILSNPKDFRAIWDESILHATQPAGGDISKMFCLAGDKDINKNNRAQITKALYSPPNWAEEVRTFCETQTTQLLNKYTIPFMSAHAGASLIHEVDIVRDVISLATTHAMAAMFSLPIKTPSTPHGIYTEHELYAVLGAIFMSIFFDGDVANSFKLRETAQKLAQQLGGLITLNAKAGVLSDIAKTISGAVHFNGGEAEREPTMPSFGNDLIGRIVRHAGGGSVEKAVWGSILMTACAGTANQTQVLAQCLDYYLGDEGKEHLPEMIRLAGLKTKEADDMLMKYLLEGSRLRGTVALYRETTSNTQTISDYPPCFVNPSAPLTPTPNPSPAPKKMTLPAGTKVFVDLTSASHDPAAFPDPEKVDLSRPTDSYLHYGLGPHQCLGQETSRVMMLAILKSILAYAGEKGNGILRRADGARGELKSFDALGQGGTWMGQVGRRGHGAGEEEEGEGKKVPWSGLRVYMKEDQSGYWPLPSTLRVRFGA